MTSTRCRGVARSDGLSRLFAPDSIALVGASADRSKAGGAMISALESFAGSLYPVNPRSAVIAGRRCYPKVSEIEEVVDLAVVVTPAPTVPGILRELANAGVGAAVICAGGFGESGMDGTVLERQVADVVRASQIRVLGPNTSGFMNPGRGVTANFMPAVRELAAGPIGIVAQSGGVNLMLSFLLHADRRGVSIAVGLGNAVDVGFSDVLAYLADDPATRAIALHVEGVARGRNFVNAVAAAAERKPVVALKVGRSDVGEFARSHTGALTGDWELTRAALTQAGAVVVDGPSGLIDAVSALSLTRLRPLARPGVGVITGQAGPGLLVADQLRSAEVAVPELTPESVRRIAALLPPLTFQRNPVDTGRPESSFVQIARAVAADPAIDALLLHALVEPSTQAIVPALAEARTEVPTVFATGGPVLEIAAIRAKLESAGIPTFAAADRAANAVAALVSDAGAQHRRAAPRPAASRNIAVPTAPAFDELEAKAVVAQMGVAVPRGVRCTSHEDAHRALAILGPPVVVKVLDRAVLHKTEHGAVHLGVRDDLELEKALNSIDVALPGAAGYLVEEPAASGVELLVGATRDPSFGPAVLLALGGVDAEITQARSLALAPLAPSDAAMMLDAIPRELREGHRGRAPVPEPTLIDLLVATGDLMVSNPHVDEFEINPLRVMPDGTLQALDALIVAAPADEAS